MTAPSVGKKIRIRYSKLGRIRFTSQRDVARMWERALRRSRLPVAWSGGFSPHPLLSFGLALPTCAESLGEYLDIQLETGDLPGAGSVPGHALLPGPGISALQGLLASLLPSGLTVQAVAEIPPGSPSLQHEVSSCTWDLEVGGVSTGQTESHIDALLRAESVAVRRMRKGRTVEDDIRPAVRSLALVHDGGRTTGGASGSVRITATLATRPRGVRPGELLRGLGTDLELVRACRTHQWIEHGVDRWEPLTEAGDLPGSAVQHAQERAS